MRIRVDHDHGDVTRIQKSEQTLRRQFVRSEKFIDEPRRISAAPRGSTPRDNQGARACFARWMHACQDLHEPRVLVALVRGHCYPGAFYPGRVDEFGSRQ